MSFKGDSNVSRFGAQPDLTKLDIDLNNNNTGAPLLLTPGHENFAARSASPLANGAFFPKKTTSSNHLQPQMQRSSRTPSSSSGQYPAVMPSTSSNSLNSSNKKKRVRTSFKHQQLRAMKAYFQINPNPDAKDLKELSERTGLQKRVLQVWFQNSRAKQRKSTNSSSSSSTVNRTMSPNPLLSANKSAHGTAAAGYTDKSSGGNGGDKNYNRVLSQYLDDQHGSSSQSQLEMNPSSNNSNFLSNSNSLLFPDDDENGDFEEEMNTSRDDDLIDNDDDDEENEEREDGDEVYQEEQEEDERRSVDFESKSENICKEISGKIQNTSKRLKKQASKSGRPSQASASSELTMTVPNYHVMSAQSNENFMVNHHHESYRHHHHHHVHHHGNDMLLLSHYQQQQAHQQHHYAHPAPSLDYFCF